MILVLLRNLRGTLTVPFLILSIFHICGASICKQLGEDLARDLGVLKRNAQKLRKLRELNPKELLQQVELGSDVFSALI